MITTYVSIGLGLIALASGMFLLAKTRRDALGLFFKIISYFIIVVSLLTLACTAFHGALRFYMNPHFGKMMMGHERMMSKGMDDRIDGMRFHKDAYGGNYGGGNNCPCMDGYNAGYRDGCRDSYHWGHDGYDWRNDNNQEMGDTANLHMEKNQKK